MVYTQIQLRRGTNSEWLDVNPVLAIGEPGYETDTDQLKVGDGIRRYKDLPYYVNYDKMKEYVDKAIILHGSQTMNFKGAICAHAWLNVAPAEPGAAQIADLFVDGSEMSE